MPVAYLNYNYAVTRTVSSRTTFALVMEGVSSMHFKMSYFKYD